MNEYLNLLY